MVKKLIEDVLRFFNCCNSIWQFFDLPVSNMLSKLSIDLKGHLKVGMT